jgi:hypothetical protein
MRKQRLLLIREKLGKIIRIYSLQTQDLRMSLIADLRELFRYAKAMAVSQSVNNPDDWLRVCAYIAQVINSLASSYDEIRINEALRELDALIEEAQKRAGKAKASTPIA